MKSSIKYRKKRKVTTKKVVGIQKKEIYMKNKLRNNDI